MKSVCLLFGLFLTNSAFSFVSGSVSAPPGSFDAEFKLNLERGLLGAQDIPETEQKEKSSITTYTLSFGRNFGSAIGLEDFSLRLSGMQFQSADESVRGVQKYASDSGQVFGLEASANFIHEVERVFGAFVRGALPVGMNTEKFGNPKVDTLTIGLQSGFVLSGEFGVESVLVYGSGLWTSGGRKQNSSIATTQLFSYQWPRLVGAGLTLKGGTFLEAETSERSDSKYGVTGLRGFRMGAAGIAAVRVTETFGVEAGVIQKLTGAFFRATKDYFLATKVSF